MNHWERRRSQLNRDTTPTPGSGVRCAPVMGIGLAPDGVDVVDRAAGRGAARRRVHLRQPKLPTPSPRCAGSGPTATGPCDPQAVRQWALINGIEVSDRGRVSGVIVQQWRAATQP